MKNKKTYGFLFILLPLAIFVLIAAIVMWLWNAILPELFGFKMITFWQASGLLILSKILFGGFHGGGKKWSEKWKQKHWQEKMQNMSDEDRERFREKLKERFGNHPFCRKDV